MNIKTIIKEEVSKFMNQGIEVDHNPDKGAFKERVHFKIGDAILDIGKYSDFYSVVRFEVPEEYRGQGIGTKLMKYALDYFSGYGLSAQVSNDRSVDLHHKLGFRAFDDNGNELSLQETKQKRAENSSVRMLSPDLYRNLGLKS